ncbi:septum formation initiator family protein [Streptomyces thermoalcalitolerans]|uniref:Septum formation initiator n=1 Tax=Streptomyces thermoalcalitolerans TaxID=65605 RepID=A0ABP3YYR9_9ACTN
MSRKPELRGRAARLARLFPAHRNQAARTPFVLLVVLLLGGGLIALLMLNSALSEGAFRREDLRKETKNLTDEEQALQRDIDAYSAPDALQRRAQELGMVPGGDPVFLSPDGTVRGVPSPAQAPAPQADAPAVPLAPEALTTPYPAPGALADTAPPTGAATLPPSPLSSPLPSSLSPSPLSSPASPPTPLASPSSPSSFSSLSSLSSLSHPSMPPTTPGR